MKEQLPDHSDRLSCSAESRALPLFAALTVLLASCGANVKSVMSDQPRQVTQAPQALPETDEKPSSDKKGIEGLREARRTMESYIAGLKEEIARLEAIERTGSLSDLESVILLNDRRNLGKAVGILASMDETIKVLEATERLMGPDDGGGIFGPEEEDRLFDDK